MDEIMLRDPEVFPSETVLESVLGDAFPAYSELLEVIVRNPYDLEPEWRYYNDGHAWLCKFVNKKKTVFWLTAWDGYFTIAFYFTAKNAGPLAQLDIAPRIKKDFEEHPPVGKLLPLVIKVRDNTPVKDILSVAAFKKKS